ncbi:hypothetical protein Aperf_G00000076256 [Anoplocephala perfoliata]
MQMYISIVAIKIERVLRIHLMVMIAAMTEIGFSLCGSGFSPSGMNSSQDAFWVDTNDFLEPPLPQLNFSDLKLASPGSTKSTSSLDSLLQGVTNTPPSSPWKGEMVEDNLFQSTDSPIQKNIDLDDSVNELWEINVSTECRTPIVQSLNKKSTPLLGTDLLQAFGDSGAVSTANKLEEQLASADNAWTAALELPTLAAEDVSNLLVQAQKSISQPSNTPNLRKRRRNSKLRIQRRSRDLPSSDSESTESGSEGGEGNNNEYESLKRKRSRMFIAGRVEMVEDMASSEDEVSESINRIPTKRRTSNLLPSCQTPTRHYPSLSIDYSEPWWPQHSGSIQQRLNAKDLDGCGGVGRSRRQMELWEFILRSLDARAANGNTKSAFIWVDRSIGIFRVTDTQRAAKEWGFYRGNDRMDYEKMARAMR